MSSFFYENRSMLLFAAVGVLAAVILCVAGLLLWGSSSYGSPSRHAPCYFIEDSFGNRITSEAPPEAVIPGSFAVWKYFNEEGSWGYVFGPRRVDADRPCIADSLGIPIEELPSNTEVPQ